MHIVPSTPLTKLTEISCSLLFYILREAMLQGTASPCIFFSVMEISQWWPMCNMQVFTSHSCTFRQNGLTCTECASQFTPCSANIHANHIVQHRLQLINDHTWVGCVHSMRHSSTWCQGLICYKVHWKPSCLMEGEWGPTDKGSSVAVDPLHLHIAHLANRSWTCITDGGDRQMQGDCNCWVRQGI